MIDLKEAVKTIISEDLVKHGLAPLRNKENECSGCGDEIPEDEIPEERGEEKIPAHLYCSEKCYEDRPLGTGV